MTEQDIAKICHTANRILCELHGDLSQKSWEAAEDWQKESAVKGVQFTGENPDTTPEGQHNAWMAHKAAEGWVFGEVKDAEAKTHPCMISYDQLPADQRIKDVLFRAITTTLLPYVKDGVSATT